MSRLKVIAWMAGPPMFKRAMIRTNRVASGSGVIGVLDTGW
jgi:hypothetical protein